MNATNFKQHVHILLRAHATLFSLVIFAIGSNGKNWCFSFVFSYVIIFWASFHFVNALDTTLAFLLAG